MIAIYTAELFPTAIRSTAMGTFNQASRCGSIAAPFMLMLGSQLNIVSTAFIPYMVSGGVSALAGLLVLLLPETLGAPMPESMEVGLHPHFCTLTSGHMDTSQLSFYCCVRVHLL